MRLRALHLAGIFLLLASLSTAEASVLRDASCPLGAHFIGFLLAQQEASIGTQDPLAADRREPRTLDLPAASLAGLRATWTMRPPSAHSLRTHAVTGSSL